MRRARAAHPTGTTALQLDRSERSSLRQVEDLHLTSATYGSKIALSVDEARGHCVAQRAHTQSMLLMSLNIDKIDIAAALSSGNEAE